MIQHQARTDVHVHSKHSDRPSEWLLRRIGAPESFVEPLEVYRRAKAAGMDFVTISDHNCIDGALEIAHLPGVFLSNEVTTYFPEDGCKIHLLVLGVDEAQHRMIDSLRPSLYELRDYLLAERIAHSVAHPFFRVNDRLTPAHVEKLLLLFDRFEALNGARDGRASHLVDLVFRNLTPEWIDRAAERHRIDPVGEEPWRKSFTGGSDDHSGLYVGHAFTVTPPADSVAELLEHLRAGRCERGGRAGSSLRLAHSFYQIAYQYYRQRFGHASQAGPDLIEEILQRLAGAEPPRRPVRDRVRGALLGGAQRRLTDTERRLVTELSEITGLRQIERVASGAPASGERRPASADEAAPVEQDRFIFERASRVAHLLGHSFVSNLSEQCRQGRVLDAFQGFASLAPVALGIAPYLAAFATQHKDEAFLQDVARAFPWAAGMRFRGGRRAWITDTLGDTNGVARMIATLADAAAGRGLELEVVACEHGLSARPWLRNFDPVGSFDLPEWEGQRLAFPPFLDVLEHLESRGYREVVISTPGPLGLVGMLGARLLGLRTIGIYHTDFPRFVAAATENDSLAALARRYVTWFYDLADRVLVPTEVYRRELVETGIPAEKIEILERGVDTSLFHAGRRDPGFYERADDASRGGSLLRVLYVGRLAPEKNLGFLLRELRPLLASRTDVELVLVGDGPSRQELARQAGDSVRFLGELHGETLATAYASADLFVFPSTTDTFGNVVLEAQACGLPVVVTSEGGPRELVMPGLTGLVVDIAREGAFAASVARLLDDPELRRAMGRRAQVHARSHTWNSVLDQLWYGQDVRPIEPGPVSSRLAAGRVDAGMPRPAVSVG